MACGIINGIIIVIEKVRKVSGIQCRLQFLFMDWQSTMWSKVKRMKKHRMNEQTNILMKYQRIDRLRVQIFALNDQF